VICTAGTSLNETKDEIKEFVKQLNSTIEAYTNAPVLEKELVGLLDKVEKSEAVNDVEDSLTDEEMQLRTILEAYYEKDDNAPK